MGWFIRKNNETVGPYELNDLLHSLNSGQLKPTTLVREESKETWVEVGTLAPSRPQPFPPNPPPPHNEAKPNKIIGWVLTILGSVGGYFVCEAIKGKPLIQSVATVQSDNQYEVCTRNPLHNCQFRAGSRSGGDYIWNVQLIKNVPDCHQLERYTEDHCPLREDYTRDPSCLMSYGLLRLSDATRADPRESQDRLPENKSRLTCDEGQNEMEYGR